MSAERASAALLCANLPLVAQCIGAVIPTSQEVLEARAKQQSLHSSARASESHFGAAKEAARGAPAHSTVQPRAPAAQATLAERAAESLELLSLLQARPFVQA